MNNQQVIFDLYRRRDDAYEEKNINELEWFEENTKGFVEETQRMIEDLKDEYKRNKQIKLEV